MDVNAIVLEAPKKLAMKPLGLKSVGEDEVVVDIAWSGVSTGTERLLWSGEMPPFPGMGYPLVPGYESVGEVVDAGPLAKQRIGQTVFIPGSNGFIGAKGLFGGAASTLVTGGDRVVEIDAGLKERGVLIALTATARRALALAETPPEVIVGHGVLGRLMARIAIAEGKPAPTVWEINADRHSGAQGYSVVHPDEDHRKDYASMIDASGGADILDFMIARLARGGEIVLAGFYDRVSFAFPPAFMREARIKVAAEWTPADLEATTALIQSGALSLDGLITHTRAPADADAAYRTAFNDARCLKMILDWRGQA